MTISYYADKSISDGTNSQKHLSVLIGKKLGRFQPQLIKIEVHLIDEANDTHKLREVHCLLAARLQDRQPIAVSDRADTSVHAVAGALTNSKIRWAHFLGVASTSEKPVHSAP